ncbi:jg23644 [Pararge aegeria aegeria]|uniref:Jg23644 protein n=1 Tax=Pararge aegeria aegeria TaxID=348720 RepID=A0A8S4R084_9NEOP|nr:jg23644 [Pararge aegeria aegeria]
MTDQADGPPDGKWLSLMNSTSKSEEHALPRTAMYPDLSPVITPATKPFRAEHSIETMLLSGRNKESGRTSPKISTTTT